MSATAIPGTAKNIGIVLLTGLGDVIHGLPIANALKRDEPSRRITWIVEPMPAPIVEHHPAVDDVVVFHKSRGLAGVVELGRELARRDLDLTLNLNIYFKSIFPTLFSGAPVRLGFDRDRAADLVWLASNVRLPKRPRSHTQDMFLEFLEALDVPVDVVEWRLQPSLEEQALQEAFFRPFRRPVAAIVPASSNPRKDWFANRWAAVIDALDRELGLDPLILGGPSDREAALVADILDAAEMHPTVAMGDGIRPLLWRLHGSALLIAPDTGPVHMARAMDVPVIGLYGHTNPWRVGPYKKYQNLWVDTYTDPDQGPDPSNARPKLDRMERITVDQVLGQVQKAMERHGIKGWASGRKDPYLPLDRDRED